MDKNEEFAIDVVRTLRQAGHTALWAGGCVRDLLLKLPSADYDVATTATPEEVRAIFGKHRTLAVGAAFGVIIVLGPPGCAQIEVATFRTEGPYLDGRRPDSVSFSTPEQDAQRRDFTINGLFFDPLTQQVLDYVDGRQDLERRILRSIGDPFARIAEDKLRMLRAVRIAARFELQIDPATAAAVRACALEIPVVSVERIAQELQKLLVNRHRRRAVELAWELGLLQHILPELEEIFPQSNSGRLRWNTTLNCLDRLQEPDFELAFAVLCGFTSWSHADAESLPQDNADTASSTSPSVPAATRPRSNTQLPITPNSLARRLKLSNSSAAALTAILWGRKPLRDAPQQSLAWLKRRLSHPCADALLRAMSIEAETAVAAAAAVAESATDDALEFERRELSGRVTGGAAADFCRKFLARHTAEELCPEPLLTGDDLIVAGMKPGADFKRIIETVRDAQLNGEITTSAAALQLALQLRLQ